MNLASQFFDEPEKSGAFVLRFFDSRHIMIVAAVAFGVAGLVMLFVS